MNRIISLLLVISTLFAITAASSISGGAASSDPADSYTKEIAANEDSGIRMWFQHSTVKTPQDDTTHSRKSTYSIYMAKNEMQGANVVLYSPNETKSLITAEMTDFTAMDGSGAVIPSQLYYQFYVNATDVKTTDVYGLTDPTRSMIKTGMIPDGIAPIESINAGSTTLGKFTLTAGKTQSLYYKLTTSEDTPSGWYSATFKVYNNAGEEVKLATVFAYVWDFVIPENVSFQTAYKIGSADTTEYKIYYDYLLENRLVGMNVPGELNSSNPYLSNPRVNAFKVSSHSGYLGTLPSGEIKAIYDDLSTMKNWEDIKEKAYFYTADEPTQPAYNEMYGTSRGTFIDVQIGYNNAAAGWENPYTVVPHNENHPYPYNTYDTYLALNKNGTYQYTDDGRAAFADIKDVTQTMMDTNSVTIWCPQTWAFTPTKYLKAANYIGDNVAAKVKSINNFSSGFNPRDYYGRYFDWDSKYGTFETRINNYIADCAANGKNIKLWWYACGKNNNYTYANHLIENSGLQTQLMTWQAMQHGVAGYLYYSVDAYTECGTNNYTYGSGKAYNGSAEADMWPCNAHLEDGAPVYGNGVLVYPKNIASKLRLRKQDYIGTIRVEQLRDGVEDYEMLAMYREAYGEEAMQKLISKVSEDVVSYLSAPTFDRSAFSEVLSDDDIFAQVRIELGNALENRAEETVEGDVDGDGKLTAKDISALNNILAGFRDETATADVNGDGKITSRDISALRNIIAGY